MPPPPPFGGELSSKLHTSHSEQFFNAQAFGGCHLGKDTGESMVREPFAQLKNLGLMCHAHREFSAEV